MKIKEITSNLREALLLLWQASPRALTLTIAFNLLVGAIPAALIYINAKIIELPASHTVATTTMLLIAAYFLLGGFHESLSAISSLITDTLRDSVRMLLKCEVNSLIALFPSLRIHEDAELRETSILAGAASDQIDDLVLHLYPVLAGIAMVIPILALLGQTAWWIPMLMLAGMIPAVLVRARAERESWDVQTHHATTINELRILDRILTQPEFAKDLRMYRMQKPLLTAWKALCGGYLDTLRSVRTRNALKLGATSLMTSFCLGVPLYIVVHGFQHGRFSIAQLAFFLGALVQMKEGLAAIIYNLGDLLRVSYAIRPFRKLVALRPAQNDRAEKCAARTAQMVDGTVATPYIMLRSVGLRYRDSDHVALDKIDLTIRRSELIAIVGANGAGKSSLLKLLCGLYEPTTGTLTWSLPHSPPRVVGVFQDFARFPLDLQGNLAFISMDRADEHLQAVGLEFLSAHRDTPLTTEIAGGMDLSGGQWQRLAIARAMVHAEEADLLVFDEPTSALDPESEAEVMSNILALARQKTAVIVSHRLAMTRFVDRILVLDQGRLVEEGSHDELIARNGTYASMFQSQAMFYQDSVSDAKLRMRTGRNDPEQA